MTPEERDLRQALNARSGEASPEFRARLSATLAEGRPASHLLPALALAAAVILTVGTVGVLLLSRQARTVPPTGTASHPRVSATPTPSPAPSPTPPFVAGVLAKPPAPIVLPANAQLSAPSSNVVWVLVVDKYLYRSTDRGSTWQQRPVPPTRGGIGLSQPEVSFVNDSEGWLKTGGAPAAQVDPCSIDPIAVWHTTDAGATWQLLPSAGIGVSYCKDRLSFVDSNGGFLAAWDPNHAPFIYRSTNGGLTWTASGPLPDPPGFKTQPGGLVLRPGRVRAFGTILLVTASAQQSNAQYVFRSTDGGATWAYAATSPNPDGTVALVTASHWVQLIGPGLSIETTNAGASWHTSRSNYSQAAPVPADFVFGDSQVGYATVRGGISRTIDGGLHWTSLHTPGT
ncbi:MAG: hypothetical protein M3082_20380 [Candidatus Dormibacteraeota bacterium]|nr:hypothetical protein [Candidatus Dormibacteraeota bacterium]